MLIDGVVKLVPVATCVVNVASLYHLITSVAPPDKIADKLTVPVPHLDAPVPVGAAGRVAAQTILD